MATLHSSPYSIRLQYNLQVFPYVEYTEWWIYYLIEPLLFDQPFLRPNVLVRHKQPHGTIQINEACRTCDITNWLRNALNGGRNKWSSIEVVPFEIWLMPVWDLSADTRDILRQFEPYEDPPFEIDVLDKFLIVWRFGAGFFTGTAHYQSVGDIPYFIHQWVSRQQLEQFIADLEQELAKGLRAAGVKVV